LRETGAAGGVLRVRAGVTFPQHRHHGNETTYVLEGGYVADGRTYGPGWTIEMTGGTEHDYQSAPERDLVIMVLHRGITRLARG
jgi:anti-sigma factor ChrR (cupin superfamily)